MTARLQVFEISKVLAHALERLAGRLEALEAQLDAGENVWSQYCEMAAALAAVVARLEPGANGQWLTTAQMAERMGVKSKTLLKWRKAGKVQPAVQLGKRGTAAIRWKGTR